MRLLADFSESVGARRWWRGRPHCQKKAWQPGILCPAKFFFQSEGNKRDKPVEFIINKTYLKYSRKTFMLSGNDSRRYQIQEEKTSTGNG